MLIFLSGLLCLGQNALAASFCPDASLLDKLTRPVDLTSEMPPIRDQDSIGWCYGFTAADLLTHYLYKTKGSSVVGGVRGANYRTKGHSVSSIGISAMYNQSKKSSYGKSLKGLSSEDLSKLNKKVVAEGGSIHEALIVVKEKGFCYERDLSSEDYSYVEDYRCAVKNRCNVGEILNIIYDAPKARLGCDDLKTINTVFNNLSLNTIKNVLVRSAKQNALANLVNVACDKKFTKGFFTDHPTFESKTIKIGESPKELMNSLDAHLNRGIPVGISYYADFLTGRKGKTMAHASSIVGKRFNKDTCEVEYILRNSWGYGCGYYEKENPNYHKCTSEFKTAGNPKVYMDKLIECRKKNPTLPRNPRVRCEDSTSYVYVRKSDLEKQIYNITTIEEDSLF